MKIDGFLKLFIDNLESITGPLYYEDEIEEGQDVIRLELEDYPYVVFEVDLLLEYMNMYQVFSYTEYTTTIRESGCDVEDIEYDIAMYYEQKDCEALLRKVFQDVQIWEDGCWGCPCFEMNVGLSHVPCDIHLVRKFMEAINTNSEETEKLSNEEWRERKIGEIFQNSQFGSPIDVQKRTDIDYKPLKNDNVVQYVGKEYVFFKSAEKVAAISKNHYESLLTFIEEIEFFNDFSIRIFNENVQFITCTYLVDIKSLNYLQAVRSETLFFDSNLSRILLFLSDENIEMLRKTISEFKFSSDDMEKLLRPHIYTEGKTDSMHMKHAMHLSKSFSKNKWYFDDNQNENQKGDRELLSDCRTYCKDRDATHVKIAIFDRDGSIPLKEIEDPEHGFKAWGNKVYSFALPVPEHRIDTPNISIEHYYNDNEIFHEYDINGVMRRLFMGYEFDKVGRAPQIGRMRRSSNKCGPESIAIIDSEVYDPNSTSEIDYALSKSKFAEKICSEDHISIEAKEAFALLFEKILEIIKYDADHNA